MGYLFSPLPTATLRGIQNQNQFSDGSLFVTERYERRSSAYLPTPTRFGTVYFNPTFRPCHAPGTDRQRDGHRSVPDGTIDEIQVCDHCAVWPLKINFRGLLASFLRAD